MGWYDFAANGFLPPAQLREEEGEGGKRGRREDGGEEDQRGPIAAYLQPVQINDAAANFPAGLF